MRVILALQYAFFLLWLCALAHARLCSSVWLFFFIFIKIIFSGQVQLVHKTIYESERNNQKVISELLLRHVDAVRNEKLAFRSCSQSDVNQRHY